MGKFPNSSKYKGNFDINPLFSAANFTASGLALAAVSAPKNVETIKKIDVPTIAQMVNCKIPANEFPIIFPIIN